MSEHEHERCVCGSEAYASSDLGPYCSLIRCSLPSCWHGPAKPTAMEAWAVWDRVMRAVRIHEHTERLVEKLVMDAHTGEEDPNA